MPKVIHYGNMFVFPDHSSGSYCFSFTHVWANKVMTKYFSAKTYKHPKLSAEIFASRLITSLYGKKRADYISSIPQWIKKMKFGCQVGAHEAKAVSRGVEYDAFRIYWTDYWFDSSGKYHSRRRTTKRLYNQQNKKEVEHKVSLFLAQKRAETTFSQLHSSALNFEYDLD